MQLSIDHVEHLSLIVRPDAQPSVLDALLGNAMCAAARAAASAPPAPAPQPPSKAATLRIGQGLNEQGGIFVGWMRDLNGAPDYGLILPTSTEASIEEIMWAVSDGDTEARCALDGQANTKLLAGAAIDFPAARWAAGLEVDGFKDFYLPSRRELALCWVNVPTQFASGAYWTSTQDSRFSAWFQYFDAGDQHDLVKQAKLRARAVRRFIP